MTSPSGLPELVFVERDAAVIEAVKSELLTM